MLAKNIGAICELIVAEDLLIQGYEVFRSISQHASCDLIAIRDDETVRVEVRTALMRKDGSVSPHLEQRDKCDLYAFVHSDLSEITYMTPEEAMADNRNPASKIPLWRRPA